MSLRNYSGGSIDVLKKNSDGNSKAKQVIQHYGKGLNPKRQALMCTWSLFTG
jgi:6-phosphogluconolactonase